MRKTLLAVLTIAGIATIETTSAVASSMNWKFQTDYPFVLYVKLFSSDRDHVWPSAKRVYTINTFNVENINISCTYKEKICYGAWVTSRRGNTLYWGVGSTISNACTGCCYICEDRDTGVIKLSR
jgi:hypothetical protein